MTMHTHFTSEAGVTLIETMIAMLVLTVGAVGMAAMFLHGMQPRDQRAERAGRDAEGGGGDRERVQRARLAHDHVGAAAQRGATAASSSTARRR